MAKRLNKYRSGNKVNTKANVTAYLKDMPKWIMFYNPDCCCNISRTLIAKVEANGAFGHGIDAMCVLAGATKDAYEQWLQHRLPGQIAMQETMPHKLTFPIYYIFDGEALYVTDVDTIIDDSSGSQTAT
jgi:hypothetical protein